MKNFKTILAVALAATVTLASCSKEDNGSVNTDVAKFQVKITTEGPAVESRAIGGTSEDAPLSLVGGSILFSNSTGYITKVIKIVANTATPGTDEVKVSEIEAGATIANVDEGTKVVTFIGSHTGTGLPTTLLGANIADVRKASFTVANIADGSDAVVSNVPIYGYDDALNTTGTGDSRVIAAVFDVTAIGSRIQISGIKGGANVKSFTVGGIWINNYLSSATYGVAPVATTIVNNEGDEAKYVAAYSAPVLCDVTATGIGTMANINECVAGPNQFFAYNIFPNIAPLAKANLPHVVVRLDNLTDTSDNNHGTKYITVKGYIGGTQGEIINMVGGYSYTFGGSDGLVFNLDNVTDKPEQGEITGKVTVSAIAWKDELVTPEF